MANEKHLNLLKQGVEVWNRWREKNPEIRPDLSEADLRGVKLIDANLCNTNFIRAHLRGADFRRTDFVDANLFKADLRDSNLVSAHFNGTDLREADLRGAHLRNATLNGADLSKADLSGADLRRAHLCGVDLNGVDLSGADLSGANLTGADFNGARIGYSRFGDVDLREVQGLETVKHLGPSSIGIDTIYRSKDNLPQIFLQRAGVPDDLINYIEKIKIFNCLYTPEQLDRWIKESQKLLTIIMKNIHDLEYKKALAGPIAVPLNVLRELEECEAQREEVEAKITEYQRLKNVYY